MSLRPFRGGQRAAAGGSAGGKVAAIGYVGRDIGPSVRNKPRLTKSQQTARLMLAPNKNVDNLIESAKLLRQEIEDLCTLALAAAASAVDARIHLEKAKVDQQMIELLQKDAETDKYIGVDVPYITAIARAAKLAINRAEATLSESYDAKTWRGAGRTAQTAVTKTVEYSHLQLRLLKGSRTVLDHLTAGLAETKKSSEDAERLHTDATRSFFNAIETLKENKDTVRDLTRRLHGSALDGERVTRMQEAVEHDRDKLDEARRAFKTLAHKAYETEVYAKSARRSYDRYFKDGSDKIEDLKNVSTSTQSCLSSGKATAIESARVATLLSEIRTTTVLKTIQKTLEDYISGATAKIAGLLAKLTAPGLYPSEPTKAIEATVSARKYIADFALQVENSGLPAEAQVELKAKHTAAENEAKGAHARAIEAISTAEKANRIAANLQAKMKAEKFTPLNAGTATAAAADAKLEYANYLYDISIVLRQIAFATVNLASASAQVETYFMLSIISKASDADNKALEVNIAIRTATEAATDAYLEAETLFKKYKMRGIPSDISILRQAAADAAEMQAEFKTDTAPKIEAASAALKTAATTFIDSETNPLSSTPPLSASEAAATAKKEKITEEALKIYTYLNGRLPAEAEKLWGKFAQLSSEADALEQAVLQNKTEIDDNRTALAKYRAPAATTGLDTAYGKVELLLLEYAERKRELGSLRTGVRKFIREVQAAIPSDSFDTDDLKVLKTLRAQRDEADRILALFVEPAEFNKTVTKTERLFKECELATSLCFTEVVAWQRTKLATASSKIDNAITSLETRVDAATVPKASAAAASQILFELSNCRALADAAQLDANALPDENLSGTAQQLNATLEALDGAQNSAGELNIKWTAIEDTLKASAPAPSPSPAPAAFDAADAADAANAVREKAEKTIDAANAAREKADAARNEAGALAAISTTAATNKAERAQEAEVAQAAAQADGLAEAEATQLADKARQSRRRAGVAAAEADVLAEDAQVLKKEALVFEQEAQMLEQEARVLEQEALVLKRAQISAEEDEERKKLSDKADKEAKKVQQLAEEAKEKAEQFRATVNTKQTEAEENANRLQVIADKASQEAAKLKVALDPLEKKEAALKTALDTAADEAAKLKAALRTAEKNVDRLQAAVEKTILSTAMQEEDTPAKKVAELKLEAEEAARTLAETEAATATKASEKAETEAAAAKTMICRGRGRKWQRRKRRRKQTWMKRPQRKKRQQRQTRRYCGWRKTSRMRHWWTRCRLRVRN